MSLAPDPHEPIISIENADEDFFAKVGPVPTAWDDGRRYPRYYYRTRVQTTIYPPTGAEGQPPQRGVMLTRDLSRGGVNLLHTGQLFPGQRIDIVFMGGVIRSVEVMWCRRLAHRCYSLGCRFIKADDNLDNGEAD